MNITILIVSLLIRHDEETPFIIDKERIKREHIFSSKQIHGWLTSSQLFRLLPELLRIWNRVVFLPYLPYQIPLKVIYQNLIAPLFVPGIYFPARGSPKESQDSSRGLFAWSHF